MHRTYKPTEEYELRGTPHANNRQVVTPKYMNAMDNHELDNSDAKNPRPSPKRQLQNVLVKKESNQTI